MSNGCKDCTKRHRSCHKDCSDYKAYKDELAKKNEHIRQEKETQAYVSVKRGRFKNTYRKTAGGEDNG